MIFSWFRHYVTLLQRINCLASTANPSEPPSPQTVLHLGSWPKSNEIKVKLVPVLNQLSTTP
jgi:hypothetical protein